MTVRELLNRTRKSRYMVDACKKDLIQAKQDAYSLKAVRIGDKIQTNHQSDLEQLVERVEGYEEKLQKNMDELIKLKLEASRVIQGEDDLCIRAILYRRYILGESWKTISYETGYSRSWGTKLIDQSIERLEQLNA